MILTLLVAFFSLIALMVIHEFGHFILAKKFGVKVEEFGLGYPPRILGKKIGETIYSLNLIPFGAHVRIAGEEGGGIEDYRSFAGLPIWQRVAIVLGGIFSFWIVALILFIIVFGLGAEVPVSDEVNNNLLNAKVKIVAVAADSPAFTAGLKGGDAIIKVKDKNLNVLDIKTINDFQNFVKINQGEEINLTIERNNNTFDVSLIPRDSPPADEGPVGVALQKMAVIVQKHRWQEAPLQGTKYCIDLTIKAVQGLVDLVLGIFTGRGVPQGVEMTGPVGITVLLARAFEFGPGFFLYFIGAIAILVALFNLLPIPALDGGKLLFLAIEKIKGKTVSFKTEQTITTTFFFLLIILAIFVTIKFDIPKLSEFIKSSL